MALGFCKLHVHVKANLSPWDKKITKTFSLINRLLRLFISLTSFSFKEVDNFANYVAIITKINN